jgi:hypothetical protein
LDWTPRARFFGGGAQAMYPLNPSNPKLCTKNKQQGPMSFYCAEYEGFSAVATRLLPQCTKLSRLLVCTSP